MMSKEEKLRQKIHFEEEMAAHQAPMYLLYHHQLFIDTHTSPDPMSEVITQWEGTPDFIPNIYKY